MPGEQCQYALPGQGRFEVGPQDDHHDGNAWRAATAAWQVPAVIGEALMAAATVVTIL